MFKFSLKAAVILILIALTACGGFKKVDQRQMPDGSKAKARKNIEEGRGVSVGGLVKGRLGKTTYEFSTSNPMWRASLSVTLTTPTTTVSRSPSRTKRRMRRAESSSSCEMGACSPTIGRKSTTTITLARPNMVTHFTTFRTALSWVDLMRAQPVTASTLSSRASWTSRKRTGSRSFSTSIRCNVPPTSTF